jgi:hypothetical protein
VVKERPVPIRHIKAHPDRAFLIIEVADSSLKIDRDEKLELYAEASVPEHWIVNLAEATIERRSEPAHGAYGRLTSIRERRTRWGRPARSSGRPSERRAARPDTASSDRRRYGRRTRSDSNRPCCSRLPGSGRRWSH